MTTKAPNYRMTGTEQAAYVPPPCPRCGSTDVEVVWFDVTTMRDSERYFQPNGFICNTCHRDGSV